MALLASDDRNLLRSEYQQGHAASIIRIALRLQRQPDFLKAYGALARGGKVRGGTPRIDDVVRILVEELEKEEDRVGRDEGLGPSFYQLADALTKRFNKAVGAIYLETALPNDTVQEARLALREERYIVEEMRLSDELVERFKNELVRIEKGRRALIYVLQQHSYFPIKNAVLMSQIVTQLHELIANDYRYLTVKPHFIAIPCISELRTVGEVPSGRPGLSKAYRLFDDYITSGEEPSVVKQIEVRFALIRFFDALRKHDVLPTETYKDLWSQFSDVWTYRPRTILATRTRGILKETLHQANIDRGAVAKVLAGSFVDEYRSAEKQMGILSKLIAIQLAETEEFLHHLDGTRGHYQGAEEEKIRIAREQTVGLAGVFDVSDFRALAQAKPMPELERAALSVPPSVTPENILAWLDIYSIIFSNAEFLEYTRETVDLSIMRKRISNLSAYHLMRNIVLLRAFVERSLDTADEEKAEQFKRFNEALKIKLQGLMRGKRAEERSIRQLIEDLGFINNKKVQFLVAETFKGFQSLVDAFESVSKGYFIQDRDALIRESRNLYDEICSQCLRNLVHAAPRKGREVDMAVGKAGGRRGGLFGVLSQLFSRREGSPVARKRAQ
jgi:hypothetical protein